MRFLKPFIFVVQFVLPTLSKSHPRFSAVTNFSELEELYKTMKVKESHLHPNPDQNATLNQIICQNITKSGYFELMGEDPVNNIDQVYDELKEAIKTQMKWGFWNVFFKKLMNDYRRTWHSQMIYTYPVTKVTFSLDRHEFANEFVFPCLTRTRTHHRSLKLYYVSDPYEVSQAVELRTEGVSVQGRFLCLTAHHLCRLVAIAEESATAITSDAHPIEELYLQMRQSYKTTENERDDPLCRLSPSKKLRICASALSSFHFAGKVKFLPDYRIFRHKCQKIKVTFRTDTAKAEAQDRVYEEWGLPCEVKPIASDASPIYVISRAYTSHYVFVYEYQPSTEKLYIHNISKNIGVVIDTAVKFKSEDGKLVPVKLDVILKNLEDAATRVTESGKRKNLAVEEHPLKRVKAEPVEFENPSNRNYDEAGTSVKQEKFSD